MSQSKATALGTHLDSRAVAGLEELVATQEQVCVCVKGGPGGELSRVRGG